MGTKLPLLTALTLAVLGDAPAAAQQFASYTCRDGSQFALAFFPGSGTAYVQLDGKSMSLPRRISVSGARYAKDGITLRINGDAATLRRAGKSTQCAAE